MKEQFTFASDTFSETMVHIIRIQNGECDVNMIYRYEAQSKLYIIIFERNMLLMRLPFDIHDIIQQ